MDDWLASVEDFFARPGPERLTILGVGNPIKGDDSVGLFIAGLLRKTVGSSPSPRVSVKRPMDHPEVFISKLDLGSSRLLILDAVEAGRPPGSVIFANIEDTRYGFFATHNIPLRLLPSVRKNGKNVYVLGVQPRDLGVGEGLSELVEPVARELVSVISGCIGGS